MKRAFLQKLVKGINIYSIIFSAINFGIAFKKIIDRYVDP